MLARKTLLIMVLQGLGGLLGYVGLFFIARYMGPTPLGIVAFALSFTAMFGIVKRLGFNDAHVKRVSEGKNLGECIGTFSIIRITLTFVYVATIFSALYIWTDVLGRGFETPEHIIAIYIMIFYGIITSIDGIMRFTFMAKVEAAKLEISLFLGTVVRIIATVFVALSGQGAIQLAFTYILAETTVTIVAGIFFRDVPIKKPSMKLAKNYSVFALPLIITSSIAIIITNIDKVFIQLFWGAAEVGYYFAVNRLAMILLTFAAAIAMLLFPTISKLHAKNEKKQIITLVANSERYLSMVAFPIVLFMIVLPKPIIHILLSDSFYPAIPVLQILPIWALISIISRPYSPLILGMDRPWLVTISAVARISINIVLNLLLIPIDIKILGIQCFGLGATGAAIATLVAGIFGFIYFRVIAWRLIGFKWNPINILKHLLAAEIMALILLYIHSIFEIARWYQLLAVGLLALGIYFAILYAIREFKKKDYHFFMDTLNPRKMFHYVKDEIKGKK